MLFKNMTKNFQFPQKNLCQILENNLKNLFPEFDQKRVHINVFPK